MLSNSVDSRPELSVLSFCIWRRIWGVLVFTKRFGSVSLFSLSQRLSLSLKEGSTLLIFTSCGEETGRIRGDVVVVRPACLLRRVTYVRLARRLVYDCAVWPSNKLFGTGSGQFMFATAIPGIWLSVAATLLQVSLSRKNTCDPCSLRLAHTPWQMRAWCKVLC